MATVAILFCKCHAMHTHTRASDVCVALEQRRLLTLGLASRRDHAEVLIHQALCEIRLQRLVPFGANEMRAGGEGRGRVWLSAFNPIPGNVTPDGVYNVSDLTSSLLIVVRGDPSPWGFKGINHGNHGL